MFDFEFKMPGPGELLDYGRQVGKSNLVREIAFYDFILSLPEPLKTQALDYLKEMDKDDE